MREIDVIAWQHLWSSQWVSISDRQLICVEMCSLVLYCVEDVDNDLANFSGIQHIRQERSEHSTSLIADPVTSLVHDDAPLFNICVDEQLQSSRLSVDFCNVLCLLHAYLR